MADGYRWVVNLDLEKFFDRVHHDLVMSRVARKVKDKRLLRLIRRSLNAGMMQDGLVSQREAGMPQGSHLCHCTFLGYTVTHHLKPRLKPAPQSVKRAKDRIRQITHRGRGRNIRTVIDDINRFTRGWIGYFRLTRVKAQFEMMDQWIRRRLRKILWEQWRKPKTRCRKLMALGLEAQWARKATAIGLGAWWNAGASHMHAAINNRVLASWGLRSLLDQHRVMQRST